jgi:signal recognition particle subunit SRP54
MGPLEQIMGMLPGMGNIKALADNKPDEKQLGRVEAIICSMTPKERQDPSVINGSRRARIAQGSGTSTQQVNAMLKQFKQVQQMMKGMPGMGRKLGKKGKKGKGPRTPVPGGIPGLPQL